jgi:NAD(P)-dependent dehydrogenase (short-subunit alcohol dehydrogenase family)
MKDTIGLITGGTSGIGLATARLGAAAGARVVIAGRDPARGARALAALGGDVHYLRADVSRGDEVAALVDEIVRRWGRLDWAVNAAALADGFTPARTADVTEEDWDRTLAVDLKGVWLAMKYELRAMQAGGRGGAIVNVSSVNGLSATPNAVAYCAAKHALQGLSKTAALEYAAEAIRVNVVCPGAHRTPMLEGVFEKLTPGEPERAAAMYTARIPIGRIGDATECARAIAWLVSDEASYVTGAVLTVDGGLALGAA